MKHKKFVLGMAAVLLAFGLLIFACDNSSDGGGGNSTTVEELKADATWAQAKAKVAELKSKSDMNATGMQACDSLEAALNYLTEETWSYSRPALISSIINGVVGYYNSGFYKK